MADISKLPAPKRAFMQQAYEDFVRHMASAFGVPEPFTLQTSFAYTEVDKMSAQLAPEKLPPALLLVQDRNSIRKQARFQVIQNSTGIHVGLTDEFGNWLGAVVSINSADLKVVRHQQPSYLSTYEIPVDCTGRMVDLEAERQVTKIRETCERDVQAVRERVRAAA